MNWLSVAPAGWSPLNRTSYGRKPGDNKNKAQSWRALQLLFPLRGQSVKLVVDRKIYHALAMLDDAIKPTPCIDCFCPHKEWLSCRHHWEHEIFFRLSLCSCAMYE